MDTLVSNLDLACRLELFEANENRRYAEAWSWLDPSSRASSLPVAGGWCVYTGADSPITQAVGLGMLGEVTERDIDRLEEFFFRRGATARVSVCPMAHQSLKAHLAAKGYVPDEFENVMVASAHGTNRPAGVRRPSDLIVRAVEGDEGQTWAEVVARGFVDGWEPSRVEKLLARLSLLIEGTRCYLVWDGDEPVAGGALVVRNDIGYLLADATLPLYRQRGAQSALISRRVQDAAGAGCRVITAGVRPGGTSHRNFERQGFLVAYTRLTVTRNAPAEYTPPSH